MIGLKFQFWKIRIQWIAICSASEYTNGIDFAFQNLTAWKLFRRKTKRNSWDKYKFNGIKRSRANPKLHIKKTMSMKDAGAGISPSSTASTNPPGSSLSLSLSLSVSLLYLTISIILLTLVVSLSNGAAEQLAVWVVDGGGRLLRWGC